MRKKLDKSPAKNAVEQAVDKVEGVIQAAALMRVSPQTVYEWMRKGRITLAQPAARLARASGIKHEDLIGWKE
jgi:hypothetical protein